MQNAPTPLHPIVMKNLIAAFIVATKDPSAVVLLQYKKKSKRHCYRCNQTPQYQMPHEHTAPDMREAPALHRHHGRTRDKRRRSASSAGHRRRTIMPPWTSFVESLKATVSNLNNLLQPRTQGWVPAQHTRHIRPRWNAKALWGWGDHKSNATRDAVSSFLSKLLCAPSTCV